MLQVHDRITVPPEEDRGPGESETTARLLSVVMDACRERGFERGYQWALRDLLDSLVPAAEAYLAKAAPDRAAEARRTVYGFIDALESRISRASQESDYVTGGLGI